MKKILVGILCLSLTGCLFPIDTSKLNLAPQPLPSVQVIDEVVNEGKIVSKDIPQSDKDTLRKMYLGMSAAIEHSNDEFLFAALGHLKEVQHLSGWSSEKYKVWNDFHEATLKKHGKVDYTLNQKIGEIRPNLTLILDSLAESLR